MPIAALPPATIHLLGSAQVLTTPNSLIKELIDNALDARATSIDIIISPDTLEKIEVRDNGHGIAQEDLGSLGRRGHTSKLRSFEELRDIGGISLGFRGEALASAVELGEVTITTRTEGESVATLIKLKAPGGIGHQSRTSHPIGTTISVSKFMAKLPIRKQQALKQAAKSMTKLKELLQSYALARPSVRFNLRTTKGNKVVWSFAPRPNDGIKEVVSQVIGRDAALQCIARSVLPNNEDETCLQNLPFQIDAFLPKPDADSSKIGSGQYLCIDARPVACDKGTMKKIVTMFKKYLRATLAEAASEKVKNPFLRLSIVCVNSCYDPNVEPAKDDVLFENEEMLLQCFGKLLKEVYGDCVPSQSATPAPRMANEKLENFEILLNRKPTESLKIDSSAQTTIPGSESSEAVSPPLHQSDPGDFANKNQKRKWGFNMSKDFAKPVEDSIEASEAQIPSKSNLLQPEDMELRPEPKSGLNPWVIAKINAPIGQEMRRRDPSHLMNKPTNDSMPVKEPSASQAQPDQHIAVAGIDSSPISITGPCLGFVEDTNDTRSTRDALVKYTPDEEEMLLREHTPPRRPVNDFISAKLLPQGSLMTPPATQSSGIKRLQGVNRAFVPPLKHPQPNLNQSGRHQTTLDQLPGVQKCPFIEELLPTGPNVDLDWAMDFEKRKEEATRRRREELRSSKRKERGQDLLLVENPRSSPHKNRYNAAIASLELSQRVNVSETENHVFKTSMKDGDPRAYFIRRQKSMGAQSEQPGTSKIKRMKTNLLPMETIPENSRMYDVVHPMSTSAELVRKGLTELTNFDNYACRGVETVGLDIDPANASAISKKLKRVVGAWKESNNENSLEVEYKLDKLFDRNVSAVV